MTTLALSAVDTANASSVVAVDPAEPVFPAHYPGFPVLPGVYLIDIVDRTVRGLLPGRPLRLDAIRRCRFRNPVFPGDEVLTTVEFADSGAELVATAEMRSRDEAVMDVRLVYTRERP